MTFGEFLFSLRNDKFMSKETLASLLGVSVDDIDRLEQGEIAPTEWQLRRIAEIFDLNEEYLISYTRKTAADKDGAALRTNAHISFGTDAFRPELSKEEAARLARMRRKRAIFGLIDFILFSAALATFITVGVTLGKWHPAWAAFPLAAAIIQLMYVLGYKRTARVVIIDCVWLISVIFFLFIGIFFDAWNPAWRIFIIDVILTVIINIIFMILKRIK